MPLWPGPDRKFIRVSRIYVESSDEQFEREREAGRSARDIDAERQDVERRRQTWYLQQVLEEQDRQEADREAAIGRDAVAFFSDAIWNAHEELIRQQRALDELVHEARAHGLSWQRIGRSMEMSRQAVHKRFGSRPSPRQVRR